MALTSPLARLASLLRRALGIRRPRHRAARQMLQPGALLVARAHYGGRHRERTT